MFVAAVALGAWRQRSASVSCRSRPRWGPGRARQLLRLEVAKRQGRAFRDVRLGSGLGGRAPGGAHHAIDNPIEVHMRSLLNVLAATAKTCRSLLSPVLLAGAALPLVGCNSDDDGGGGTVQPPAGGVAPPWRVPTWSG